MNKDLSHRIRKIREQKKLTQADIAEILGITSSSYGQIERNAESASFRTIEKIAIALEVNISFLVDKDNSEV